MHGILLIYTFTSTTLAVAALTSNESTAQDADHPDPILTSVKVFAVVLAFAASCFLFFKCCLKSDTFISSTTTELPKEGVELHQQSVKRSERVLNILKNTYHSKNYHSTSFRPTICKNEINVLDTGQKHAVPSAPSVYLDSEYGFRACILNFNNERGKETESSIDAQKGSDTRILGFDKITAAVHEATAIGDNGNFGEVDTNSCTHAERSSTHGCGENNNGCNADADGGENGDD